MSVLLLDEAKLYLNIEGTDHNVELQGFIDAAEAAITKKCGPLAPVEKTERVRGGGYGLTLFHTPVVSLTSVTPVGGSAYDVNLFDLDHSAGVIEWGSGARFSVGRYDVVYQAGRTDCPDDLLHGVKELVRHMWETQRGAGATGGTPFSEGASNTVPGAAYLFPFRVAELIQPHVQVGN